MPHLKITITPTLLIKKHSRGLMVDKLRIRPPHGFQLRHRIRPQDLKHKHTKHAAMAGDEGKNFSKTWPKNMPKAIH